MISSCIKVTDKYINSNSFSLQQEHIELFLKGSLNAILLFDKNYNLLEVYDKALLDEVIGKAISNGRMSATNKLTGATEFYYLAPR